VPLEAVNTVPEPFIESAMSIFGQTGVKHRSFELRAETIAKLDRAERRQESDVEPDADA